MRRLAFTAILLGFVFMGWATDALAQGRGSEISSEAIFAALMSAAFLIVGGYTARNDRDMRELRAAMKEQFKALGIEQRQQQSQINLLSERVLREHPTKDEFMALRDETRDGFNKLENLIRGGK